MLQVLKYIEHINFEPLMHAMYLSGSVQISVVKCNKGFSNCIVDVHIHRTLLLDNKRAITGLRWCPYSKPNHQIHFVLYEIAKYHSIVNI